MSTTTFDTLTAARALEAAGVERRPEGSATITFRRPKTDADATAYLRMARLEGLFEGFTRRESAPPPPV